MMDGKIAHTVDPAQHGQDTLHAQGPAPWKSLFRFTQVSHAPVLVTSILSSGASGAVVPISAYLLGKIFDVFTSYTSGRISGDEMTQQISKNCLYFFALGCGAWLTYGVFFASWISFGELQARGAREQLYKAMLQKEMEWYDTRSSGVHTMIPRSQA
jgi:ATP-binding cassette subfamily B (MDR/TAP) protein 1